MRLIVSVAAVLFAAAPALAQHNHRPAAQAAPRHDHGPATKAAMPSSPVAQAYAAANEKMHRDMSIPLTGDADQDFARGMIPHHQGAIDMAKIVLQYGSDPELKKIAEEIISAQEKEIALFKAWLERRQK